MILGMTTFTFVHVLLSLIAIAAGAVVAYALLSNVRIDAWTAVFFITMVATSATGFGFSSDHFLPSHAVGILSLVVLAMAILARYVFHYARAWRWIYVVGVVLAFYFDVFVAIVQAFQKIPTLAPMQGGPPFLITQIIAVAAFVALGVFSVIRFHPRNDAVGAMPVSARQ